MKTHRPCFLGFYSLLSNPKIMKLITLALGLDTGDDNGPGSSMETEPPTKKETPKTNEQPKKATTTTTTTTTQLTPVSDLF